MDQDSRAARRQEMVEAQIAARGIRDVRVLAALRTVPREAFVPASQAADAFDDRALAIGMGQTISQPYIVALMTEALAIRPDHRILEIGTGTGYQTAILASLAKHVYTVERLEALGRAAKTRLESLDCSNISYRVGDGSKGWPEEAPFDGIIVTAAAPALSAVLVEQLAEGGRLEIPIGEEGSQRLSTVVREQGRIVERPSIAVRFVRLVGEAGFSE